MPHRMWRAMTYTDAIKLLYELRWFGAKFGLENTFQLAAQAGNPHRQLRFIHVAGTNGKGSTCAMLESIYRAAGLRVGLYTSPHLVSFRERIQVNRRPLAEADVLRLVCQLQPLLKEFPPDHHPTFFEVVTVMALRYFAEQECELVIWETGLGGRLDATNIVTPLASVITNIGFDHQQWLGDTLEQIAGEKAGIIKPGVPVLTATEQPEALAEIERAAAAHASPLTVVTADGRPAAMAEWRPTAAPSEAAATGGLSGGYQRLNAALARATVEVLRNQIPVSDDAVRRGLAAVCWPGRLQLVPRPGGQHILLDGAHNPAGAAALRQAIQALPAGPKGGDPLTLILGILADKDCRVICDILAPLAGHILLVPVGSERSARPEILEPFCRAANPRAAVVVCDGLPKALAFAGHDPFVVIAGSLYLIGEAMELLGLSPVPAADEKALNNWQPARGGERAGGPTART